MNRWKLFDWIDHDPDESLVMRVKVEVIYSIRVVTRMMTSKVMKLRIKLSSYLSSLMIVMRLFESELREGP